MTDKIPENSDAHRPPSDLQAESLTCTYCESELESMAALREHEGACEAADDSEGE